jgi:DNA-binding transcriptional regulator YiaG
MPNKKMTELGKELARLRKKYSLPRREIALLLQVTEQSIFRWDSGRAKPQPYLKERLGYLIKSLQEKEAHDE